MASHAEKLFAEFLSDPLIQECVTVEPAIEEILHRAAQHRLPDDPLSHAAVYGRLKEEIEPLVGWFAKNETLRTVYHYTAVITAISDLLYASP